MRDARNQRTEAGTVELRDAAPGHAAVVGKISSRIAVSEGAARRTAEETGPGGCDVIVEAGNDAAGIIGIHCDRGLILWSGRRVLVHGNVGSADAGRVQRT